MLPLPRATQQAAGAFARQLCCSPPLNSYRRWRRVHAAHASASSTVPSAQQEQQNLPHVSVLLQEVLHSLNHMPIKVYVDCTLGAGGHMEAMMQQHPELEHGIGIDVDPLAHSIAAARLGPLCSRLGGPQLHQLQGNYSDVVQLLSSCTAAGVPLVGHVDAMLMDLGVSSMQLDAPERGFSFMADGPIDMRMDPQAAISAEELVNCAPEAELARILRDYGEEKSWRAVARRIVTARETAPIKTTQQLVQVVGRTQLRGSSSSSSSRGRHSAGGTGRGIHPATRTFQALRIAVNEEIVKLEKALPSALSCLSPGGRLAVISFHSLEDRAVKHAFLTAAGKPTPEQEVLVSGPGGLAVLDSLAAAAQGCIITRKPVTAGQAEIQANPRSRSAKLRVFEKAGGPSAGADASRRRGSSKRHLQQQ